MLVAVDILSSLYRTSQYYTTDPQTDGILVLAQDEVEATREI
jgi:hypothetical protein